MKDRTNAIRRAMLAVAAVALAAIAVGCEDSAVTVPNDGNILVTVNPNVMTIDPNQGQTQTTAQIVAAVFNNEGRPLEGVSLLFSTGGGTLSSNGQAIETDAQGLARDTVTVTTLSPSSFQVTVQSSAVIQTADVLVEIVGINAHPFASIFETPTRRPDPTAPTGFTGAQINETVIFDGTDSTDPDGDVITCFQWTLLSDTVPANNEVIQGPGAVALSREYAQEQVLTVFLRVSDRQDVGNLCVPGGTPVPDTFFLSADSTDIIAEYPISCVNEPPVADAGPDLTVNTFNPQGSVFLDGTESVDPDAVVIGGRTLNYSWNCGNQFQAIPTATPGQVFCPYSSFGTFSPELTVTDNGDGTVNPQGLLNCTKISVDSTTVTVQQPPV